MKKPLTIVIPMAGFGTRLRPLTWSKPKSLVPLAGKTVLDHLLNMFRTVSDFKSARFVLILGSVMGEQIRDYIAQNYPEWHVDYAVQPEMKGQSDAFWQARELLHGPMLMAFSDTLIDSNFSFLGEISDHAIAFVKPVPDPRRFGVAEIDEKGAVTRLIEKPADLSNNLALVGCYYFPEAEALISAIEEQMDKNISLKGEYFLVDAINILLAHGQKMRIRKVDVWLDAGTPEAVLETNRYLLEHGGDTSQQQTELENTVIVPPVFIHTSARVNASTIGPNVSIGEETVVQGSIIKDSIIGSFCHITNSTLHTSLLGHHVTLEGQSGKFHLGDNSQAVK